MAPSLIEHNDLKKNPNLYSNPNVSTVTSQDTPQGLLAALQTTRAATTLRDFTFGVGIAGVTRPVTAHNLVSNALEICQNSEAAKNMPKDVSGIHNQTSKSGSKSRLQQFLAEPSYSAGDDDLILNDPISGYKTSTSLAEKKRAAIERRRGRSTK